VSSKELTDVGSTRVGAVLGMPVRSTQARRNSAIHR